MSAHTKLYLPGLVNEDGTAAYLLATDDGNGGMTLTVGATPAAGGATEAKQNLQLTGLPYGADEMVITNVAAGPSEIVYKLNGTTLKTRTFTYTNAGASASDVLTGVTTA